jgi:uncharacterized membrane protein YtjA (UPF0391 family)
MFRWAAIFFVIALFAALFGFTGIAAGIAKILFFMFVVLFLIAIIGGTLLLKKK